MIRFRYKMFVIRVLFIVGLIALTLNWTDSIAQNSFPKDTSFTAFQTWLKLRSDFPEISIVKPQLPPGVLEEKEVVYATLPKTSYGRRELHLDLYRPEKQGKYPAILFIHGGGWRSGNKRMDAPMAQQLASRGYVTAMVEYRLSPEALYPAAVFDIKAAIRFLRANATKWNINPEQIVVAGSSAGGQLAALVGLTGGLEKFNDHLDKIGVSDKVQAIIDIDGILDFTDPNESAKDTDPTKRSAGAYWFGATYAEAPGKWIEASPLTYAGKKSPPMLFVNSSIPRFHAGRDSVVAILKKYGIYTEVQTIPDSPHAFWLFHPWFMPTIDYIDKFVDFVFRRGSTFQ